MYSYCKSTNIPSIWTVESIGMRFDREYPDEVNQVMHVSVIDRKTWMGKLFGCIGSDPFHPDTKWKRLCC